MGKKHKVDIKLDSLHMDQFRKSNQKVDGWSNIYTRQGVVGKDKRTGSALIADPHLSADDNRILFRSGFGRKVVEIPVDDMVREWFTITGDPEGKINQYLFNELKGKLEIRNALTWASVYGGSIMLMGLDDGASGDKALEQPLNEENIKSFKFLKVYDRYQCTWNTADLYYDPTKENFGQPEFYRITPLEPVSVAQFRVHESRVIRFDGPTTDDFVKSSNNWWNDSIYQGIFRQLRDLNHAYSSVYNIMDDFVQVILQIENLQNMIAAGQDELIKTRMNIIDMGRHVMNTIMLDGKENYSKETSSATGLDKLLIEAQQALSAVTGIPMTRLMGRAPGGLNASGDSDESIYYDKISSKQETNMLSQMHRLVYLVQKTKEGPTKGVEIPDWSITFNPLKQMTLKEESEVKKLNSESDVNYISSGVLDPNEVREQRFSGDKYGTEIQVEGKLENDDNSGDPNTGGEKWNEDPSNSPNNDVFSQGTIALAGTTSIVENHSHAYIISDNVRYNGSTSKNKDHIHQIINGEIQPAGKDDHIHELEILEDE